MAHCGHRRRYRHDGSSTHDWPPVASHLVGQRHVQHDSAHLYSLGTHDARDTGHHLRALAASLDTHDAEHDHANDTTYHFALYQ